MLMYRMFEEKNGLPCTLFHGVNGSRTLPLDTWVDAETKEVTDGKKSKTKKYMSGFHGLTSMEMLKNFLWRFRNLDSRVLCAVEVDDSYGVWVKPTNNKVLLAKRIRIPSEFWEKRIPCSGEKL